VRKVGVHAGGEFVREEMHHVREGKHGARSTKQAIAIGLSKARRAGVRLKPPTKRQASARTRRGAPRCARPLREEAVRAPLARALSALGAKDAQPPRNGRSPGRRAPRRGDAEPDPGRPPRRRRRARVRRGR
jgi:hypothetical protein